MAYTIWMLEKVNIAVSGGGSLDGITQGDGSHLPGRTITLLSNDWIETQIADNDPNFDDNDTSQRLQGAQTINGVLYPNNTIVEAEYLITLRDPSTGITYRAIGYNVNNSSPAYATIEGLAFVGGQGGFPPVGVPLVVVSASEGPGSSGIPAINAGNVAFPICFGAGTCIATPAGDRRVETLRPGDAVLTRDHGAQILRWVGVTRVDADRLAAAPAFRPVRIRQDAFGAGAPARDTLLSQQHRLLMTGWRAELLFGEGEVLVAARHLVDGGGVKIACDVTSVIYVHLMFDDHEVVFANGLEAESFRPGPAAIDGLDAALRDEILALFPDLAEADAMRPARALLRGWEGAMLQP
ncbi:Hint domain-containing protein [Palleronia sp. KMU-117]|uniref:Hint domain-containing protein n=1 Tax=Palleronia sp. KMU-117 TaxID=3434108 RepID=UPI003D757587